MIQNTHLNAETKNQALNRQSVRVFSYLYSLIFCGLPCIKAKSKKALNTEQES